MKLKYLFAAVLLIAGFAACSEKPEEENDAQNEGLEAEFNIAEEAFSVQVGESKEFKITVTSGQNVKYAWYVDDEKVSSTASVTWKFDNVGTTVVKGEVSDDKTKLEQSYTVTVTGIPLDVTFTPAGNAVEAVIGTPFTASVAINAGDKQTTHEWKLDGEVAGDGLSFTKTFELADLGEHTLIYNGANADGSTATHTWTINVVDLPLEVNFTPAKDTVDAVVGTAVDFAAEVVHGATGATYAWEIDGEAVADATAASFSFTPDAEGEVKVSCIVTNDAEEEIENEWVLAVAAAAAAVEPYMLLDAENLTEMPAKTTIDGNANALSIVENPCVSTVNPGTKVFKDDLSSATWSTSGYVKIYPRTILGTDVLVKYKTVRIKVYIGKNEYLPYMLIPKNGDKASKPTKVNGTAFYPNHSKDLWNSLVKHDDWNVLEYNVETGNYQSAVPTLADAEQFQFRFMVDYDNKNSGGTLGETNTHIVYFDDIEILE